MGGLFQYAIRGFGVQLPVWLTTGYRTALLSSDPEIHGLLETAPQLLGVPDPREPSGVRDRDGHHVVAPARRARERPCEQHHGGDQACRARACSSSSARRTSIPANYRPFAPNGFTGIHQGAAIVFFAYIGFDAISTAAEETRNPATEPANRDSGGTCHLHPHLRRHRSGADGDGPYPELAVADPLARALQLAGFEAVGWIVALGAAVSMTAVLLVFSVWTTAHFLCDGARRPASAMGRAGPSGPSDSARHDAHHGIGVGIAALIGDAAETYDLTNIGTLLPSRSCASACSCCATPIRASSAVGVPFVWVVSLLGTAGCVFIMQGLPRQAWERFGLWLAIGLVLHTRDGTEQSISPHPGR